MMFLPNAHTSKRLSMRPSMSHPGAKQAGFTIIEMMIALILGLIVVSAVVNMYIGSTRSATYTRGLQTMQENGRYGVSVLQRGFRLAGYSPDDVLIDPINIAESSGDSVTVVMRRSYDCNGNDTASAATPGFAENTYAFDSAQGIITCEGNTTAAVPMTIVEGVDGFRVLYGLDTDDDSVPERYVSYSSDIPVRQIVGLRFAMLVNSGIQIRNRVSNESFVVLDDVVPTDDRFARNVFSSTVLLRNRL